MLRRNRKYFVQHIAKSCLHFILCIVVMVIDMFIKNILEKRRTKKLVHLDFLDVSDVRL